MVNLEFAHAPASLTAPAILLQHLLVQASVRLSVKPQSRASRKHARHGEPHVRVRNSFLCDGDRNS